MFPDFRYLIQALFGFMPPDWVGVFKVFGFLVAISFLAATWVMTEELRRKEKEGIIGPTTDKKTGRKIWPHQRISEIVMIAAVAGFAGAKLFNGLENWSSFIKDPINSLFSRSGLTFYGGFITATAVFYYYARKHKIRFRDLCDCAAPAIMLAYGIGRLGCQFAGDGDWGIYNSAYITAADGTLQPNTGGDTAFYTAVPQNLRNQYGVNGEPVNEIPHKSVTAPGWLPVWMFAQNYPHNVNNDGIDLANCTGDYCRVLPAAVFPTPLYEFVVGVGLFFLMWGLRRRLRYPLHMFALYLFLAGLERMFVEQIRVNTKYDWGFMQPTQAEIISGLLMLSGLCIFLFYRKKRLVSVNEEKV